MAFFQSLFDLLLIGDIPESNDSTGLFSCVTEVKISQAQQYILVSRKKHGITDMKKDIIVERKVLIYGFKTGLLNAWQRQQLKTCQQILEVSGPVSRNSRTPLIDACHRLR